MIHASCEDYRAAATIDLAHDAADGEARVECPLLVLWGEHGAMHRLYDVLETWRALAADVRGQPGALRPLPARGGAGRDRGRPGGVLRRPSLS